MCLGIQTQGGRMEGTDESTELRRHPLWNKFDYNPLSTVPNPLHKAHSLGRYGSSSPSTEELHGRSLATIHSNPNKTLIWKLGFHHFLTKLK